MYKIEFTDSAEEDLRYFKKYEQILILDEADRQLLWEPSKETRNRKRLEPNDLSVWELRIGEYRLFYNVDESDKTVKVKAVGWKRHNQLFIQGKVFTI
jgi:mRNA-degrading endonuclease RelE of RelBE toxin-antitoxin system